MGSDFLEPNPHVPIIFGRPNDTEFILQVLFCSGSSFHLHSFVSLYAARCLTDCTATKKGEKI